MPLRASSDPRAYVSVGGRADAGTDEDSSPLALSATRIEPRPTTYRKLGSAPNRAALREPSERPVERPQLVQEGLAQTEQQPSSPRPAAPTRPRPVPVVTTRTHRPALHRSGSSAGGSAGGASAGSRRRDGVAGGPPPSSAAGYIQADDLTDTPYAAVDPMQRFQRLHRPFVQQQRRRGPLFEFAPLEEQAVEEAGVAATAAPAPTRRSTTTAVNGPTPSTVVPKMQSCRRVDPRADGVSVEEGAQKQGPVPLQERPTGMNASQPPKEAIPTTAAGPSSPASKKPLPRRVQTAATREAVSALEQREELCRGQVQQAERAFRGMVEERLYRELLAQQGKLRAMERGAQRWAQRMALLQEDEACARAETWAAQCEWRDRMLDRVHSEGPRRAVRIRQAVNAEANAAKREFDRLPALEAATRQRIEQGEANWFEQLRSVARSAAANVTACVQRVRTTGLKRLRALESQEGLRRRELAEAEATVMSLIAAQLRALGLAAVGSAEKATTTLLGEVSVELKRCQRLESTQRQRIMAGEHSWATQMAESHRARVRVTASREEARVARGLPASDRGGARHRQDPVWLELRLREMASAAQEEEASRQDLMAAEDVWRLLVVQWAASSVAKMAPGSGAAPPLGLYNTATPAATSAAAGPPAGQLPNGTVKPPLSAKKAAASQWVVERDEESGRMQWAERERRTFDYIGQLYHRAGVILGGNLAVAEKRRADEAEASASTGGLGQRTMRAVEGLSASEEAARNHIAAAEARYREEWQARIRSELDGLPAYYAASPADVLRREEASRRDGLVRAESGWRGHIELQLTMAARRAAREAAPSVNNA